MLIQEKFAHLPSIFFIFQFLSTQKTQQKSKKLSNNHQIYFFPSTYFSNRYHVHKRHEQQQQSINNDKNVRWENLSKERKLMVGDTVAWNECRWFESTKTFFFSTLPLQIIKKQFLMEKSLWKIFFLLPREMKIEWRKEIFLITRSVTAKCT